MNSLMTRDGEKMENKYAKLCVNRIDGNDVEFVFGDCVAYGTLEVGREGDVAYCVDHAPTHDSMDAICHEIDRLSDDDIKRAIKP